MTDTAQAPVRLGSRVRGILGAFLGGTAGMTLCGLLIGLLPSSWNKLAILSLFFVGSGSCLGYRLFRGLRSMRFAWNTVRVCTALSVVPGLTVTGALCSGSVSWAFRRLLESFQDRKFIVGLAAVLFLVLLGMRPGLGLLLRYVDPGWHADPRRLAQVGGGGAMFNEPPCWPLPPIVNSPEEFETDKGKLKVKGNTITVRRRGRDTRSFSVEETAGVILGVCTGYNILYDKENRELARFAWSRKNAVLLGQYLIAHGVPFLDVNGVPVPTTPQAAVLPQAFTVREGKLLLWLGWVGLVLIGGVAVACALVLEGGARLLYTALSLFPLALFVSALLCYYNRRLEVDGEALTYTTLFGRTTRFLISDVKALRPRPLSGTRELLDQNGRRLARYEDNMDNAFLLARYLSEYNIPLSG